MISQLYCYILSPIFKIYIYNYLKIFFCRTKAMEGFLRHCWLGDVKALGQ